MKYLKPILLLSLLICFACSKPTEPKEAKSEKKYPEIFNKVLEAHGGKSTWDAMNTLTYTKVLEDDKKEEHTVDLKTRKSLIEVKGKYKLGHDGADVWVSPHRDSFPGRSPRFAHNLLFYFVAVPFVFTDPGVNVEDAGMVESGEEKYHLLKVTFEANVGDAPEDRYNMYIDPKTHKVDFITYSVTYFDKTRATNYYALKYDWVDGNGLLVPEKYRGYKWENEALGDQRYESILASGRYEKTKKADEFYAIPEGAFVDK